MAQSLLALDAVAVASRFSHITPATSLSTCLLSFIAVYQPHHIVACNAAGGTYGQSRPTVPMNIYKSATIDTRMHYMSEYIFNSTSAHLHLAPVTVVVYVQTGPNSHSQTGK